MYSVGQQILDGKVTVVTVDSNNLILSVEIPTIHDLGGNPFTITYNAGVTEQFVGNLVAQL